MKISRVFISLTAIIFFLVICIVSLNVGNVFAKRAGPYNGPKARWIGGASGNFNQSSNWERSLDNFVTIANEAPLENDMLMFLTPTGDTTITYDVGSDMNFSYIYFDCRSGGSEYKYTVNGSNAISADGDITNYSCANVTFITDIKAGGGQLNGPITVKRLIGGNGLGYYLTGRVVLESIDSSFDGNLNLGTGISGHALVNSQTFNGDVPGTFTVFNPTTLEIACTDTSTVIPMAIRAEGAGSTGSPYAILVDDARSNKNGPCGVDIEDLTLSADTTIQSNNGVEINIRNLNLAGYRLTVNGVNLGKLRGSVEGDHSSENSTVEKYELILKSNSKIGNITVEDQGVLKGNGQAAVVVINSGGKLAPGLSPGIITVTDLTLNSGSGYDVELGGTTPGNNDNNHDQTVVSTGVVTLNSANLNVILWNGYRPTVGDTYTVINKQSAGAISGTFNNLAEGSTFIADGVTYRITYAGGDGNDVVLTATAVTTPAAPNTGAAFIQANPIVPLIGGLMIALGLSYIARKQIKVNIRK
jgi:hypothetical protein